MDMSLFTSLNDWVYPIFIEIFACQNDPEAKHITLDSLTDEEKSIIANCLPNLLLNFMKCDFTNKKDVEREMLSGLVLFRTEILPMFREFFDAEQLYNLFPIIDRLNKWEKHFKKVIINGNAAGMFKAISCVELYSCSESSMTFMNGARQKIGAPSFTQCEHGCLTDISRATDGSLQMQGKCAWMLLPNIRHAGCGLADNGHVLCKCDRNNCNEIATHEQAKKLGDRYVLMMLKTGREKDSERMRHEIALTCKKFAFLYKWDDRKITTHLQPTTDVVCENKRCYIHVEKHEYFVSKMSGGCEGTIMENHKMHGDILEEACDSAFCNELKDADEAEGYYELWRDHHPISMDNQKKN